MRILKVEIGNNLFRLYDRSSTIAKFVITYTGSKLHTRLPTGQRFGGKIYSPGNGLGNDLHCLDVVRCKLLGNTGQQPMSELRWPFYNIITTKE